MISQIDIEKILHLHSKSNQFQFQADCRFVSLATVLNQLVELLNAIVVDVDGTKCVDGSKKPAENVQQTSYIAPGDITVFHGFNCSVEFDIPLPKGTRITIKSITKGGDNE